MNRTAYNVKMFVADVVREVWGTSVCEWDKPDSNPSEWMTNEETHERRTEADGSVTRRVTQTWKRRNGSEYTKNVAVNRPSEYHSYREVQW